MAESSGLWDFDFKQPTQLTLQNNALKQICGFLYFCFFAAKERNFWISFLITNYNVTCEMSKKVEFGCFSIFTTA